MQAENLLQLGEWIASANARGARIDSIDLRRLNRVVEHAPADMTVTVEAGITLATLQGTLARHGQWLPIDPPLPEQATLGAILATNASGPRRLGCGTVRDWLIGMRVVLANGTVIKSGGKVVKNVAGYDLAKLFIGSHGTLGIIVEATFKLRPLPEREAFVQRSFDELDPAIRFVESVRESKLNPIVLDLHNISGARDSGRNSYRVVLGFAGAAEDVASELDQAAELGAQEPTNLNHEAVFWTQPSVNPVWKNSVLPSALGEALRRLGAVTFVARAGNGIVYYQGGPAPTAPALPRYLFQRVKDAFDPKHTLPDFTE